MSSGRTIRYDARCTDLVAIAREALVESGLERFSMREIAAKAGMTLGNLQYYYPTRADLLEAVARADFDRDLATFERPPETQQDPAAVLRDAARALLRNWSAGGGSVWLTVAVLAFHDDRFRALSSEVYERFYAALGAVIRSVATDATEAEVGARARMITAVLDGVALQFHSAQTGSARQRADLTRRAIATVEMIARSV